MQACMAAVLVGVMRLLGCPFDGAWCLVCELCLLAVVCVDCRCSLSLVLLGGAGGWKLSSCNTVSNLRRSVHNCVVACRSPRVSHQQTCQK